MHKLTRQELKNGQLMQKEILFKSEKKAKAYIERRSWNAVWTRGYKINKVSK